MAQTTECDAPKFMEQMPLDYCFKIHIAIDFGTDGLGMPTMLVWTSHENKTQHYSIQI